MVGQGLQPVSARPHCERTSQAILRCEPRAQSRGCSNGIREIRQAHRGLLEGAAAPKRTSLVGESNVPPVVASGDSVRRETAYTYPFRMAEHTISRLICSCFTSYLVPGTFPYAVSSPCTTRAFMIFTSSSGRFSAPVLTKPIFCTTRMPLLTLPKMVCLPSNHGVGASVMKNCEPFVLGPELAMLRIPAPVCLRSLRISSSNFSPQMEAPPRPVPVGSPPYALVSLCGARAAVKQLRREQ